MALGTRLGWPYISARPLRWLRGRPRLRISSMARRDVLALVTLTMKVGSLPPPSSLRLGGGDVGPLERGDHLVGGAFVQPVLDGDVARQSEQSKRTKPEYAAHDRGKLPSNATKGKSACVASSLGRDQTWVPRVCLTAPTSLSVVREMTSTVCE